MATEGYSSCCRTDARHALTIELLPMGGGALPAPSRVEVVLEAFAAEPGDGAWDVRTLSAGEALAGATLARIRMHPSRWRVVSRCVRNFGLQWSLAISRSEWNHTGVITSQFSTTYGMSMIEESAKILEKEHAAYPTLFGGIRSSLHRGGTTTRPRRTSPPWTRPCSTPRCSTASRTSACTRAWRCRAPRPRRAQPPRPSSRCASSGHERKGRPRYTTVHKVR